MAKRYHQSRKDRMHEKEAMMRHMERMHRDRMHEREGMERYWHTNPDMHNDERHHDKDRYPAGPYHYDRERYGHAEGYSRDRDERARYRMNGGAEHYAGMEPRRRQEMRDAGMIHEDPMAVANLPQTVSYHPYPKPLGHLPEQLDDTIRGIDNQIEYDHGHMMKEFYPKKV
jgi:hypothetical protein